MNLLRKEFIEGKRLSGNLIGDWLKECFLMEKRHIILYLRNFFAEMSSNELRTSGTSTKYIRCRSMLNGSM